jgi:hypothetical protein
MKLETSVELLERVRAAEKVSWWKLPRVLDASESTVKNWKHGRTTVDRRFAPRIAELLHESPEYVVACLEAEREQHQEMLKVWQRIAAKFRSSAASSLFVLCLSTAGAALPVQEVSAATPEGDAPVCILWKIARRRRQRRNLKNSAAAPLKAAVWTWARIRSMGSVPSSSWRSPAPI